MSFLKKFFFSLLIINTCLALVVKSEGNLLISANEIINDDLYLLGNCINIEGTVNGDVFVLSKKLVVTGKINGDLNCAGATLYLNQETSHTVRALAKDIYFKGHASQDFITAGEAVTFYDSAHIEKNLAAACNKLILAGTISGNAKIKTGFLQIEPLTVFGKNLEYGAPKTEIAKDITINGQLKVMEQEIFSKSILLQKVKNHFPWLKYIFNRFVGNIYAILILSIFGVFVLKFMPAQTTDIINEMLQKPGRSISFGLLTCLAVPFLSLLLALTVVGIPFALAIFSFFGFGFYISKVFVCILLGKLFIFKILKQRLLDTQKNLLREMLLGIMIYYIIVNIPILGFIFAGLTTLLAIGAFMGTRQDMYRRGLEKGIF